MKVLYVIDTLNVGGTERSLLEIASRLQKVEPVFCHLYAGETLKPQFEAKGIRVHSVNLRGKYSFVSAYRALSKVVRLENPDVIHASLFRAEVVSRMVARRHKKPFVGSFVNDSYGAERWKELRGSRKLKHWLVMLADRWTIGEASRFLSVSSSIRESNCAALGVAPSRVEVIPRGRDASLYMEARPQRSEFLRRLGLAWAASDPIFLNVGRLLERKGQAELLGAMALLRKERPEARLLIAGEGGFRKNLEKKIQELGLADHVALLGERSDVRQLLAAVDGFAFTSYYEGLPGALLEAMLAGLPIVASDIPMHRELLPERSMGLLAPLGDVQAYARAMLQILEDPEAASRMGRQARAFARQNFDLARVARRHEEYYEALLKK